MNNIDLKETTPRRGFLGTLAGSAAMLGLANLVFPSRLNAESKVVAAGSSPADAWFSKVKGKHRIVFDAAMPHEIFSFAWPKVFLMTNEATGTPASQCGVVVVLRHSTAGF